MYRQKAEKDLQLLLRCFRLVCAEVAAEYAPLRAVETVRSESGTIEYAALGKSVLEILSVESGGRKFPFAAYPSHFTAAVGDNVVTYYYMPPALRLPDALDYETAKVGAGTLAYGVAAEFCLVRSDFEQSQMWDKRYRDGLQAACRRRKEIRLPPRGWY
jgi:hypothetical protein